MKRFCFKLGAVLTLRQRAEQAALEKYSRATEHRQTCAGRVSEAEMGLSEARRQWLHALADGCPAARASQILSFCHLLEDRKKLAEQTLHLAEVELNQATQRMLLARQQREAIEKLQERQRQRHDRHLLEEERKMVDDLVGRGSSISRSGGAPAPHLLEPA